MREIRRSQDADTGRPFATATVDGPAERVVKYIDQIHSGLVAAMILTGTRSVDAVEKKCS